MAGQAMAQSLPTLSAPVPPPPPAMPQGQPAGEKPAGTVPGNPVPGDAIPVDPTTGAVPSHPTPPAPVFIPGAPSESDRPAIDPQVELMSTMIAREISRVAVLDLRAESGQPDERDFKITCALLQAARAADPNNLELVRRHAEAAFSAGERGQLLEATRRILELDPGDTVAQLRRISVAISQIQTVESRLAAYDKLLGRDGESLDVSVRSRLAFDAALLAREQGDDTGFIRRLTQACQLDSTNKEAALLAYSTYSQRGGNPKGRFDLLNNLLLADPRDFSTYISLRDECAADGAFKAASRFNANAMRIFVASGGVYGTKEVMTTMAIVWGEEGPEAVVTDLNRRLVVQRDNVRRAAESGGGGLAGTLQASLQPGDVRLDAEFDQMRIAASIAAGDDETRAIAMLELNQTLESSAAILADRNRRGAEISDEQAVQQLQAIAIDLQLWRLLTGNGEGAIADVLKRSMDMIDDRHEAKRAILAWTALRSNAPEESLRVLDEPGRDSSWTKMARATALLQMGRTSEAGAVFWAITEEEPLSPLAGLARLAATKIGGPELTTRQQRAKLIEASAKAVPVWVDQIIASPKLFHTLNVTMNMPADKPLVPATAKIQIRNLSPIPLGLGSSRTINSRILFAPSISATLPPLMPAAESEVIEFNSRLRIVPGEEVSMIITPNLGVSGWLESVACVEPIRVRYRVMQGFQTDANGHLASGVGGIDTITPVTPRDAVVLAQVGAEAVAANLRAAPEIKLPEILSAARAVLFAVKSGSGIPNRGPVIEALVEAYPKWNVQGRVLALAMMPPTVMVPELSAFDEVVRAETDPYAVLLALVTRVTSPTDPLFETASKFADHSVVEVAKLHQDRLTDGIKTYSTAGIVGPVITP
jgi:tetratricopeptide (TPR) repeat protein